MLYCCRGHKFAIKALLCNNQYFTSFTVTCSSTTHRKRTVAFHCNNDCANKLQSNYPILFCTKIILTVKLVTTLPNAWLLLIDSLIEWLVINDNGLIYGADRDLYLPFVCSCERDKELCDSMNSTKFLEYVCCSSLVNLATILPSISETTLYYLGTTTYLWFCGLSFLVLPL